VARARDDPRFDVELAFDLPGHRLAALPERLGEVVVALLRDDDEQREQEQQQRDGEAAEDRPGQADALRTLRHEGWDLNVGSAARRERAAVSAWAERRRLRGARLDARARANTPARTSPARRCSRVHPSSPEYDAWSSSSRPTNAQGARE